MSAPATGVQEWRDIPWAKVERDTHTLQKRIYQASLRGDVNGTHRLQRLMISSWQAKCLAVRRVTQDNQGKNTAGVDGIKSLTPPERLRLVNNLSLDAQPSPTRRVWIPKPGTEEKRPLGIPTMPDRALQALVKLALEPEWEAKFEPNSYGFRPGRSCHDAIAAIFINVSKLPKYGCSRVSRAGMRRFSGLRERNSGGVEATSDEGWNRARLGFRRAASPAAKWSW